MLLDDRELFTMHVWSLCDVLSVILKRERKGLSAKIRSRVTTTMIDIMAVAARQTTVMDVLVQGVSCHYYFLRSYLVLKRPTNLTVVARTPTPYPFRCRKLRRRLNNSTTASVDNRTYISRQAKSGTFAKQAMLPLRAITSLQAAESCLGTISYISEKAALIGHVSETPTEKPLCLRQ